MRRALPLLICCTVCCIAAVRGAAAEQLRTKGNELFCLNGQDLLSFVVSRSNMPGCRVLHRGLAYTLLENSDPAGRGIIKVRLRRLRGGSDDGYMMTSAD
jgi:hypothetical protein